MLNKLGVLIKKLAIPVLFFIIGLAMIVVAFAQEQNAMFKIAALLMFTAGILSILYSLGKLKASLLYIIGAVAGIAASYTLYMSYKSVDDTKTYQENYAKCSALAIQNLQDIRYVQKIYIDQSGKYIGNWDEFTDFVKNGKMPYIISEGTVPTDKITVDERKFLYNDNRAIDNNMTEEEAYRLSKWKQGPRYDSLFANFKRDTVMRSILDLKFKSKSYVESRKKNGFTKFSADSLMYIPYTKGKEKWTLETKDSVKIQETTIPTLRVSGNIPFTAVKGKKDKTSEFYFGNLMSSDLSGSWENN